MARMKLVSVTEMTDEHRAQYDRFPSNITRALLLLDQRLADALPNLTQLSPGASSLDAAIRKAVILRVAAVQHSAYERMQYLDQARKVRWSDSEIASIESSLDVVEDPSMTIAMTEQGWLAYHSVSSEWSLPAISTGMLLMVSNLHSGNCTFVDEFAMSDGFEECRGVFADL